MGRRANIFEVDVNGCHQTGLFCWENVASEFQNLNGSRNSANECVIELLTLSCQWDDVLVSEGTLEWERVNGVAFHDYHASAAGGQQGQDQAGAGEEDGDEDSEGSEVPEGPDSGDDAEMEEE